jgi:hypothetical protein
VYLCQRIGKPGVLEYLIGEEYRYYIY